ncbi:alkaline phosphatase family protein [Aliidiomarina indica]|uniref:alkaline phosphatase family protein n=1 Tax=Aliidiomarina indica TaxID=2749147 RepID=UPI00188F5E0B|nr:alkaline phosphatase family protein [Aliidiomarina indica]
MAHTHSLRASLVTAVAATTLLACTDTSTDLTVEQDQGQPRAILVSIDSINETIMRNSLSEAQVPAFYNMFNQGACSEGTQPSFPSLTAAGHSALWTGAYGNISNISGNTVHPLPRDQHTVLASASGYSPDNSAAEPIWITAGYQGLTAGGHHVTQAPGKPGFPSAVGERTEENEAARQRVIDGYSKDNVIVMNGYNDQIQGDAMLTAAHVDWDEQIPWNQVELLESNVAPRYFSFNNQAGTFYAALFGNDEYDHIAVNTVPDAQGAVIAYAADVEQADYNDRELARHFSEPLRVSHERGTLFLRVRLFEVAADGSDFMLFHPPMHIIEVNHADAQVAYEDYVQGWFGNSSTRMYSRGEFGKPFYNGGDGLAEARYLETAELETKLFNLGSSWFWQEQNVDLLVDYFPLGDSIDHSIKAYTYENYPAFNPEFAEKAHDLRGRAWELVNIRLQHLMDLADSDNAALFLVGDHGMRTSWMEFRPNVLLQQASLQFLDANGMIDLTRSKAVSNTGNWITVNTTDWRGGIVPPEQKDDVVAKIVAALSTVVDANGMSVIDRIYVASEHPELGIGGPAGGDVYWAEAHGYRSGRSHSADAATGPIRLWATHSHASTEPLMQTVTCAWGGGFQPNRIPRSRQIDVAPTVADYLGISAPPHAVGRSLLHELRPH